jgi:hypothetical protein
LALNKNFSQYRPDTGSLSIMSLMETSSFSSSDDERALHLSYNSTDDNNNGDDDHQTASLLSTPPKGQRRTTEDLLLLRSPSSGGGDSSVASQPSPQAYSKNGGNDEEPAAEEKLLQVMDHVEDEWDELAYDQLVPLEVRLALEEQVFGWSHLTSDILGHVFFTLGAFFLAFGILRLLTSAVWLRWLLSIAAAVSSFRTVRRRRRVWLRAAYGSEEYLANEQQRRKDIEEVDQLTWLQRLRRNRKQKKVEKQLKRAETSFLKHHKSRRRLLEKADSEPTPLKEEHRRRPSFQTDPVPMMESVQQDQIMIGNGKGFDRVPYTHGGGFGAAPFMLANPHWISILRHLMPDVYVEISRRVHAPAHRLIHWAENNPVVAAYGAAHELEFNGTLPNVEWDVFLDPRLVKRVMIVLEERRKYLLSVLPELPTVKPMEKLPELEQLSPSQRRVVKYHEKELRKRTQLLVDEMLIAHGALEQLALEQTGWAKQYNYSRVKRTRRTLGGGIFARQWMAVYAESLRIGVLDESSPSNTPRGKGSVIKPSLRDMATSSCPNTSIASSIAIVRKIVGRNEPFGLVLDAKSRHVPATVWACVVDILRETGVRVEGVGTFVMDEIRSLSRHTVRPVTEMLFFHSAGDVQQACHNKLIRYGDTILFNAGSLIWSSNVDLQRGVGKICQKCIGRFDPNEVTESYRIQPFGLSSSSSSSSSFSRESAETASEMTTGWIGCTIEDYKRRYNLSIGLYVQEFAIDHMAATLLVKLVNDHPEIYNLGLCWGGVNGITLRGIRPGRFTDTSGFWNQRHIAASWDSRLRPPV